MRLLKQSLRSRLNPFMAMFIAFLTAFGAVPPNVFASEGLPIDQKSAIESRPFIARINGKKVRVAADGTAMVNVSGRSKPVKMEVPRYVYLDGEAIPVDDNRIENISPVLDSSAPSVAFPIAPFSTFSMATTVDTPSIGFIASLSGTLPSNPIVGTVGQEFVHPAYVTMNGQIVSSRRYVVSINGVDYEAFCADPNRPGPETNASVYELTGADGSKFSTVLKYGYPINPTLSNDTLTNDERAWNAYITRVAVAYISKPSATWGNLTGSTQAAVDNRIIGMGGATAIANSPAITINGKSEDSENGDKTLSSTFALGNNRRTNCWRNPFRFEWADGTPAGTKLYVDGSHVATAPANPTNIYSVHTGGGTGGSVFIEKVDALTRENVPNATHPGSGALIRLQGISSMTTVAGDGKSVTFNNTGVNLSQVLTKSVQIAPPGEPGVTSTVGDGWWRLEGFPYGFYSVVEERAPDGFSLLPQHTAYSFWLHPPDVTIGLNVVATKVVIPWDDVLAMLEDLAGASTPATVM